MDFKECFNDADKIRNNIILPRISHYRYSLSDFFSFSCISRDFAKCLNSMIVTISNLGGGTIVIPPGDYFVKGSIVLKISF